MEVLNKAAPILLAASVVCDSKQIYDEFQKDERRGVAKAITTASKYAAEQKEVRSEHRWERWLCRELELWSEESSAESEGLLLQMFLNNFSAKFSFDRVQKINRIVNRNIRMNQFMNQWAYNEPSAHSHIDAHLRRGVGRCAGEALKG